MVAECQEKIKFPGRWTKQIDKEYVLRTGSHYISLMIYVNLKIERRYQKTILFETIFLRNQRFMNYKV